MKKIFLSFLQSSFHAILFCKAFNHESHFVQFHPTSKDIKAVFIRIYVAVIAETHFPRQKRLKIH